MNRERKSNDEHFSDVGLYVIITRPVLPYEEIAEICVRRGVRMLQLREKHLSDRQLLDAARRIRAVTRGSPTLFAINDRPDIAALSDADALHLGQDDIPVEEARSIVGEGMLIGLSTHSVAQAREAMAKNPDYIGFGPIYPTPAKAVPDPEVGTALLKEVLGVTTVPVVVIGGIFPENLPEVLGTGARNVALVRHLMETAETEKRIAALQEAIG